MIKNKINVIFIESRGISNEYGIGSYRNNLISSLTKSKQINLFCVSIEYITDVKGGVEISNHKSLLNCKLIKIQLSKKYSQIANPGANFTLDGVQAKICFSIIRYITKCANGIIHFNSNDENELAKIADIYGFKTITTQHVELLSEDIIKNPIYGGQINRLFEKEKVFLKSMNGVIFLCNHNMNIGVTDYGLKRKSVALIYNGIIPKLNNTQNKAMLKNRLGFSGDDFIFLFVGRIEKNKGILDLIKAFNSFSLKKEKIKLILVGGGNFSLISNNLFPSLAKIHFTGYLSNEHLQKIYKISDVGILPSYTEQSSFSVLEMINYNIPLILSDIPGFDIFKNCFHVLKVSYNEKKNGESYINHTSLINCMENIYANKVLRNFLIKNSKDLIHSQLNSEFMAQKTIEFYKKTL